MAEESKQGRRRVIGANLSASDRLLETIWGVLIVLSVTGSAEVGAGATASQIFIIGVVTAFAWAVIEGIMELLRRRLEHVNYARLIAKATEDPEGAESDLADSLQTTAVQYLTPEDQASVRRSIIEAARRAPAPVAHTARKDYISSFETALTLFMATLPVLLPFLLVSSGRLALALSQSFAVFILLGVGAAWGRYSHQNPVRTGLMMAAMGLALAALLQALHA